MNYYDMAINLNPQHADSYNNKGISLKDLGRDEEAIDYFDKVVNLNPQYVDQYARAYYNKGLSLTKLRTI